MEHCICIRNSDYSLYAYILYVQDASRALDGWYHSKKKKTKKETDRREEKSSWWSVHAPNSRSCFLLVLVCWHCCCPSAALHRCCSNQSHQSRAMSRCISLAVWPRPLEAETVLGVTVVLPNALGVGLQEILEARV